jgi:hypothetical protein
MQTPQSEFGLDDLMGHQFNECLELMDGLSSKKK